MLANQKLTKQSGFTIVELLIVIVIIAILAALVIVTYSGMQARARDTERQTDVAAIAKSLEIFYSEKGYYPKKSNMSQSSAVWIKANLPELPAKAIVNPLAPSGTTNSIKILFPSTTTADYGYVTLNTDGTDCDADECPRFTLILREETTGNLKTITSINK